MPTENPKTRFSGQWEENLRLGRYLISFLAIAGLAAAFALPLDNAGAQELVKFSVKNGESIEQSLTGNSGDPAAGRKSAINTKQGNCLACHAMPVPEQPFHGEVGPDLNGVGSRYSEGELRLRVVNAKILNPDTIMPAFYRNSGLHRVMKKFQGKTILTPQEVEDIVAYLMTLKE